MSAFFYKGISPYFMKELVAVREPIDNLWNTLVIIEAINSNPSCLVEDSKNGFDLALFTGTSQRFLVNRDSGYFSMANPFQVLIHDSSLSFICNRINEAVSGFFISVLKSAINTTRDCGFLHEDIIFSLVDDFGLSVQDSIRYYDTFASLCSGDHGYFRFDDDLKNARNHVHPRYHFDLFCNDPSSIKIGSLEPISLNAFMALVDRNADKRYLVESNKCM